jgi:predicted enzyme related to lactoylglutathione lyase
LPGEIVHIEIPADDTKRSQEFWGSLFGWQFQANPGPFEYHTTQIGGEQGAAITNMEPGKRGTRPYFAVDDIKAGAARVTELGGEANERCRFRAWAGSRPAGTRTGTSSGSGRPTHRLQLRRSRPMQ